MKCCLWVKTSSSCHLILHYGLKISSCCLWGDKNSCHQSSQIASPPPFSCSGHFLHHHRILLNLKSFSCPSFITLPYYNIIINKKNITTINNCKKWIIELGKHFKLYHNFLGPPGKQFGSTAIAIAWKVETNSGDNLDNLDKMRRWRIQELSFLLCNWREHLNFHTAVFQDILFREITSLFLMCGSQEMIFPVQSFFIRVGKCRGYGGYIRVKFLETWGKFFESNIRAYDAA